MPSSLGVFGGWPDILRVPEVNIRCAGFLGLLTVEIEKKFRCVLPGHDERHPSANLHWDVKGPAHTGTLKYHDWHAKSGPSWYSLADVFASRGYGEAVRLKGPETTVWHLRLLVAAGVLAPYPVKARLLPREVTRGVLRVYEGFLELLRCKWLHTPGEPTPFTWRFASSWCGMHSAARIMDAVKWLLKHGYLRPVGIYRPPHGRQMTLFLPGGES
jgi:hypothetical protein